MNRSELIEAVVTKTGLAPKQAELVVFSTLDVIIAETKTGNKVSLFGFGTFSPVDRAARTGRNPQTGSKVKIKASKAVRFAPASSYKEELNSKRKTVVKPLAPTTGSAMPAKTTAKKTTKAETAEVATPRSSRAKTAAATETVTPTKTARAISSAQDNRRKNTVPKETVPKETVPKETVPKKTAPKSAPEAKKASPLKAGPKSSSRPAAAKTTTASRATRSSKSSAAAKRGGPSR